MQPGPVFICGELRSGRLAAVTGCRLRDKFLGTYRIQGSFCDCNPLGMGGDWIYSGSLFKCGRKEERSGMGWNRRRSEGNSPDSHGKNNSQTDLKRTKNRRERS